MSKRSTGIWSGLVTLGACMALSPAAMARDEGPPMSEASAEAALAQAREALSEPASGPPSRDPTLALVRLSQALPALDRSDRRHANRILARPDDGEDDPHGDGYDVPEAPQSPACDSDFCVHWVAVGEDAPPLLPDGNVDGVPDFVDEVLESAGDSHQIENDDLGWIDPVPDGTRGDPGSSAEADRTDIYLVDLPGYFGYASPDEGQSGEVAKHGFIVLDNDFAEFTTPELTALDAMRVTMAHEYNHVLQFAYDSLQRHRWMFEATATWVEDLVYPEIDDYLNFLPAFAESPHVPLTNEFAKPYGSAVWNHFLSSGGNPEVVRDAWDVSPDTTPQHHSVAAYDDALGGGASPFPAIADEFVEFAGSTAEWQGSPQLYPDASEYPKVERDGRLTVRRTRRLELDHLAYALMRVPARRAAQDLRLKATGPAGTQYGFGLIARRGDRESGDLKVRVVEMGAGGEGQTTLPGDDYRRVTALIVNADGRVTLAGSFLRNDQPFKLKLRRDQE